MRPPTDRQKRIYDFILAKIRAGRTPSMQEIADEFGIRSRNGVICHLNALEAKGYITVEPVVSRGIRLVRRPGTPDAPCPACGCSCGGRAAGPDRSTQVLPRPRTP